MHQVPARGLDAARVRGWTRLSGMPCGSGFIAREALLTGVRRLPRLRLEAVHTFDVEIVFSTGGTLQ